MKYLTETEDGGFAITILFGENALPDVRHVPFPDIPDGQAVSSVDFAMGEVVTGLVSVGDPTRDLSLAGFIWLLNYTELVDVWDAIALSLKGETDLTSKKLRAGLAENRSQATYTLAATLEMVEQFRELAQSLYPSTDLTDALSDATITAAWGEAVGRKIV